MALATELRNNPRKNDAAALNIWAKQYDEAALEPDLPIIDPHHHLWDNENGRYVIQELVEDISTGHNILATVAVENGAMYNVDAPPALQPVGEVEFLNGVAAVSASGRYGKSRICAGIVGFADFMLGDRVQPVFEALIAAGNGRLRGIRRGMAWHNGVQFTRRQVPRHLALDATFRKAYARLQPLGLSFEAWMYHPQLPELVDLLRTFPEVSVILNHSGGVLGVPHAGKHQDVFEIWRSHMRALAQFANLSVKVGGLGMPSNGWDFHLRDVPPTSQELADVWRPYVEACIEIFGVGRCMMESNFPADKQSCGYGVLWNALKRITQSYSETEKAALYRDTAARVYRLAV